MDGGLKFYVDGVEYDIENVPTKALYILKQNAVYRMQDIEDKQKTTTIVTLGSGVLSFVGSISAITSFALPVPATFIASIGGMVCSGVSLIGFAYSSKRIKNEKMVKKSIENVYRTLNREIRKRETTKEIFSDMINKNHDIDVKHCKMNIDLEIGD